MKSKSIGEAVGKSVGITFHYNDFRVGWKEGVETSKRLGMYRQQYCGCIYSEKERYYKGKKNQGPKDPKVQGSPCRDAGDYLRCRLSFIIMMVY